jgi:mRNA interferase MazF
MAGRYVPERGDIVWLEFNPQAGHEQAGLRPAIALSPRSYNAASGLGIFCPITSRIKGYPFEVGLPPGGPVTGVILSDQMKSLDWRARKARKASSASPEVLAEAIGKARALLD